MSAERTDRTGLEAAPSHRGRNILLMGTALLFLAGYFGRDQITNLLSPALPPPPSKEKFTVPHPGERPEYKEAQREPFTVGIGVDVSRSKIKDKLPEVQRALLDWLRTNKVLQEGDTVVLCKFVEDVACGRYQFPQDNQELEAAIKAIQPIEEKGHTTHIEESIHGILDYIEAEVEAVAKGNEEALALVWTDGEDEGGQVSEPVKHPVQIVVPDQAYSRAANKVKASMEEQKGAEVSVQVATTGQAFGKRLQELTTKLQEIAQQQADEKARADHERAKTDYAGKLKKHLEDAAKAEQAYEAALERYANENVQIAQQIEYIRVAIRNSFLGILGAFALLTGVLIYRNNRPRLKGYLAREGRDGSPTYIPLPHQTTWEPKKKRSTPKWLTGIENLPSDLKFKATRRGASLNGQPLRHGQEIVPQSNLRYVTRKEQVVPAPNAKMPRRGIRPLPHRRPTGE